jgi:hypothetical protein
MASVNKIELCGTNAVKLAATVNDPNDLVCEAISLPHGVRDVLFVSDCFINADVKARLEHSPDGSAGSWSTVQWKRIVSGEASGSTWGNEKYLDTTPKRPNLAPPLNDYKNKHIKLNVTFDNNSTDIIQHKLDATSPFNLSMWMKSGEVPSATYSPILFRSGGKIADADAFDNIQSLNLAKGTGYTLEYKNKYLKADTASQTAIDSGSDAPDAFTYSTWFKTNTDPVANLIPENGANSFRILSGDYLRDPQAFEIEGTQALCNTENDWTISYWWRNEYAVSSNGGYYGNFSYHGFFDRDYHNGTTSNKTGFFAEHNGPRYFGGLRFGSHMYGGGLAGNGVDCWYGTTYPSCAGVVQIATYNTSPGVTASSGLKTPATGGRDQHNKPIVNPNDGEWHHIVHTWKGTPRAGLVYGECDWAWDLNTPGRRVYIDGWLCSTLHPTSTSPSTEGFWNAAMCFSQANGGGQYTFDSTYDGYMEPQFNLQFHHYDSTGTQSNTLWEGYGGYGNFCQFAVHDGYVTQEDVDKMYGASTAGGLDGKPQVETTLNLSYNGNTSAECKLFSDFSVHSNFKSSGTSPYTFTDKINHPAWQYQYAYLNSTDTMSKQYAFENLADTGATYTSPNAGAYSDTDLGWTSSNGFRIVFSSCHSPGYKSYNGTQPYDTSSDTNVYSPIVYPASPIIFRNGGKTEPFAINKAISIEYSNLQGELELRNICGNVIHEEKDWTIYTWYKYDSSGGSVDIFAGSATTGYNNRIQFRYYKISNGTDTFSTSLGGGYEVNFTLPHTLDDGEWHQLAWVFKGVGTGNSGATWKHHTSTTTSTDAGMKVYVDGAQAFAVSETSKTLTLQPTNFGTGALGGYGGFFDMAELGVFDSALTTSEIESLYNGTAGTAGGSPAVKLSSISSCVFYADIEAETIGAISSGDIIDNQISGNSYDLYSPYTIGNNFVASSGNVAVNLSEDFGEGLTVSISDKYADTTGAYVASGNQPNKLIVSMDGFENTADEIMVYPEDVVDDAWHNLVVTHDGGPGNDLEVHIDGSPKTSLTSLSGSLADKHLKNDTDTAAGFVIGGSGIFESSGVDSAYNFQGEIMDTSFHSEDLSLLSSDFYNSGTPADLDEVSGIDSAKIECWWKIEENTAASAPQGKNSRHLTLNNFEAPEDSTIDIPSGDIRYFKESRFGEGMTISLTDKVDYNAVQGSQWKEAGGEEPSLLISFNGFENDAEQWIAYKCDQDGEVQRNISYDGSGTATAGDVDLLDDSWHNLIINYKGVASGATAYLGPDPTGVAGHPQDGYEFHVAMDGQLTDHINKDSNNVPRGFNAAKTVNGDGIATLDIEDKHLKNVSDTYVPTTFFASGIHEVAADSKYAYQGYIDETSFHSDSWWKKTTGNMDQMCNCPLEAVWGDNAQRLTGGQGGSNVAYGFTPMDNAPSVPHDLMDPQSIMTKPGDWAYIEPFPSGMYRCNENLPGHTSKEACTEDTTEGRKAHSDYEEGVNEAINHWTVSGGGLEVYYRWGDVPTDCKSCVNEARGYISRISDDEDYTNLEDNLKRSANIEGSLDWRDLKLGTTTTEKIYVEGDSGSTGGAVEYLDAINNCSADGDHVITHLNVPHLHYVRVVYTGEGACAAGQCIASLFYRKEK